MMLKFVREENTPSRYPIKVKKDEFRYKSTVRTTVLANIDDTLYRASVVKNPKDKDNPVIGRKYAVAKLCRLLPRDKRLNVWEEFFSMSSKHRRIMGNSLDLKLSQDD